MVTFTGAHSIFWWYTVAALIFFPAQLGYFNLLQSTPQSLIESVVSSAHLPGHSRGTGLQPVHVSRISPLVPPLVTVKWKQTGSAEVPGGERVIP